MLVRELSQLPFFTAGDDTWLSEMLHPRDLDGSLPYTLAYAEVLPHQVTRRHRLHEGTEVHIVIEGQARFHVGGEEREVSALSAVVVPPEQWQWISNGPERLRLLCIVSPAWHKEDEETLE